MDLRVSSRLKDIVVNFPFCLTSPKHTYALLNACDEEPYVPIKVLMFDDPPQASSGDTRTAPLAQWFRHNQTTPSRADILIRIATEEGSMGVG